MAFDQKQPNTITYDEDIFYYFWYTAQRYEPIRDPPEEEEPEQGK